jgi:hypothetical protein
VDWCNFKNLNGSSECSQIVLRLPFATNERSIKIMEGWIWIDKLCNDIIMVMPVKQWKNRKFLYNLGY